MGSTSLPHYQLSTCRELIKKQPRRYALLAACGVVAGLFLAGVVRQVAIVPTPENMPVMSRTVTALAGGGYDLAIRTSTFPPKNCVRFRNDIMVGYADGEVQGITLGTAINGFGIGYPGNFSLHYYVPEWVHGQWRHETRQLYICPIAKIFPLVFIALNTTADLVFP